MAVGRDQFTKGLVRDMYAYSLESYPQVAPVYTELFEGFDSQGAFEQSTSAIGVGQLDVKPEGEPITYQNAMEGFTVQGRNDTFASGIEFTMEQVQDMSPTKISNMVTAFASKYTEKYIISKENYYSDFFNKGGFTAGHDIFNGSVPGNTDASGDLVYDGEPFLNLSDNLRPAHPSGTDTYYNAIAKTLTETSIQEAYELMTLTNAVDARGDKMSIQPDVLLIHPSLKWQADKLMGSPLQVGSAQNDPNTVQSLLRVIPWRYLDTATFWAIGKAKSGIKAYNRMPLTFDFFRDEDTKGFKANVVARWGGEVNDFRYWVGSNAPTS